MADGICSTFKLGESGANQFEQMAKENGDRYWYARDFMVMLGYDDFFKFENAISRAIKACASLNIPLQGTINPIERDVGGANQRDYKLSRFGCYLVAINGDIR